MSIAYDAEALLGKSRIFLERGLEARHGNDFGLFHTWAALSLELLGKAALAKVHPVLVADPNKFTNLLVACGRSSTDDVKSIGAKTVYERLGLLSNRFDKRAMTFCQLMANRRNEELHSGLSSTTGLKPEAWVPEFWRVAQIILEIRNESLEDWVGFEEATSALKLIQNSSKVLEEAVLARIRRCKAAYEESYPEDSLARRQVLAESARTYWPAAMHTQVQAFDGYDKQKCPACGAAGWIFGSEAGKHRGEQEWDEEAGWLQWEHTAFNTEEFGCGFCGLRLAGRQELDIAALPEEFTKSELAEADYEEEYGNC